MAAIFPGAVPTQVQLLTAQNNTMVVLDLNCGVGDTAIQVDDASALPASGYLTFVDTDEIIYYASRTGTVLNSVTRGADGSAAANHTAGVDLEARWNADFHNILTLEIVSIADNIRDRFGLNTNIAVPSGVAMTMASTPDFLNSTTGFRIISSTGNYFAIKAAALATSTRDITIPDPSANASFVLTEGAQTINGVKTFASSALKLQEAGGSDVVTVAVASLGAGRTYTIPDAGGTANFVLSGWAQIVNADINASAAIARSKLAALTVSRAMVTDGSGFDSVSAVTATELGYVSGVTSAIQTQLNAAITNPLGSALTITPTTNQLVLGTTRTVTITAPTPATTSRTVTIPDLSASYSVVGTEGAQTINGSKNLVGPTGMNTSDATQLSYHTLTISRDVAAPGDHTANAQLSLLGASSLAKQMALGFDTTGNYGFIQAAVQGSTYNPISINPDGGQVYIRGSSSNDIAAAGFVGEFIVARQSTFTNAGTSNQYSDLVSISLTAGDWDVSAMLYWYNNGATWTAAGIGISITSGNSSTGLVLGDNFSFSSFASSSTAIVEVTQSIPTFRFSLNSTTTVYMKIRAIYSAGTPQAAGRLSARRVR